MQGCSQAGAAVTRRSMHAATAPAMLRTARGGGGGGRRCVQGIGQLTCSLHWLPLVRPPAFAGSWRSGAATWTSTTSSPSSTANHSRPPASGWGRAASRCCWRAHELHSAPLPPLRHFFWVPVELAEGGRHRALSRCNMRPRSCCPAPQRGDAAARELNCKVLRHNMTPLLTSPAHDFSTRPPIVLPTLDRARTPPGPQSL